MPIRQKMPDFVNLAATGTASLDLPTGMSYHNLIFYFGLSGALTRAMIKEIRVLINGKVLSVRLRQSCIVTTYIKVRSMMPPSLS